MDKVCTRLQTGKAHTHTIWGGTYLHGLYKGVSPPPPHRGLGSHFEVTENGANPSHQDHATRVGNIKKLLLGTCGMALADQAESSQ